MKSFDQIQKSLWSRFHIQSDSQQLLPSHITPEGTSWYCISQGSQLVKSTNALFLPAPVQYLRAKGKLASREEMSSSVLACFFCILLYNSGGNPRGMPTACVVRKYSWNLPNQQLIIRNPTHGNGIFVW